MKRKILIMGLPGSGKTTLAKHLAPLFNAVLLNADTVRKEANDWDFSPEGRDRQALRMWTLAQEALDDGKTVIADFVCPTVKTRKEFNADYTVWMNTIEESEYQDTNDMFERPIVANGDSADIIITQKDAETWAYTIFQIVAGEVV